MPRLRLPELPQRLLPWTRRLAGLRTANAGSIRTAITSCRLRARGAACTLWYGHPVRCLVRPAKGEEDSVLPNRLMKRALFTTLGILAGSALAWGCLLSWAAEP